MFDFTTMPKRPDSRKWKAMIAEDKNSDCCPLTVADMDFLHMPQLGENLREYLKTGSLGYENTRKFYYENIIEWNWKRHGLKLEKDWFLISSGVIPSMLQALYALSEPGDGVIVFTPIYHNFFTIIEASGRKQVRISLYKDGNINYDAFEQAAKSEKNKILIFCNPHNPLGKVWLEEDLKRIAKICEENELIILSDEIHGDILLFGSIQNSFLKIEQAYNRLIVFTSGSKTFNLGGMKISNLLIPNAELRKIMSHHLQKQGMFGASIMDRLVLEYLYGQGSLWVDELISLLEKNILRTCSQIQKIGWHAKASEATFLLWIDTGFRGREKEILEKMHKKHIFMTPGSQFGVEGEGFLRMNVALPTRELDYILNRLKEI
ncbi:aminotransferase, class I/II [Peptostreptococcaceae bacterium oral taxon 113 str. W5053]|nr:aminotransferase, class I/II [Peptostreptococcaceae bacterium oral taxon 113 str. W5053]